MSSVPVHCELRACLNHIQKVEDNTKRIMLALNHYFDHKELQNAQKELKYLLKYLGEEHPKVTSKLLLLMDKMKKIAKEDQVLKQQNRRLQKENEELRRRLDELEKKKGTEDNIKNFVAEDSEDELLSQSMSQHEADYKE
jgi:predicted nuclease with TOPRIM domain